MYKQAKIKELSNAKKKKTKNKAITSFVNFFLNTLNKRKKNSFFELKKLLIHAIKKVESLRKIEKTVNKKQKNSRIKQ